ncbi:MAG: hypothetical protein ABSF26_29225 [Thermoguttaceae bacterium]|jgi:hypothetical protein
MATSQWIKKLGGHAGELYMAAELSKRGIPNSLLPENFSGNDLLAGKKGGSEMCFIQVKSCHPDRARTFILTEENEEWENAPDNQIVAFVWLGSPSRNEGPKYWIALKADVGKACKDHSAHGTANWERRFRLTDLKPEWENNWALFDRLRSEC